MVWWESIQGKPLEKLFSGIDLKLKYPKDVSPTKENTDLAEDRTMCFYIAA